MRASDREASERFYEAVLGTIGCRDDGPPGPRPRYAAYVLDPDGNTAEAVSHNR